jgi:hypothetical protein
LLNGELAINITDGKLYYKDNSGTVQVIATKGAGTIGGSTTQIQYNNAGALAGSVDMTYTSGTNTVLLTKLNLTNALGAIYGGTGLSTYTTGDLLYSSASNTLAKLAIGTANYILTVNSGGTNVQWSAPSSISVSTATNLAGGVAGSVPYQSAAATTTFLGIGAADRVMTSSGTAPQWVTALTGLTGVSSSSITNTSLTSGRVVYSGTGGLQTNSANLTFDGTTLTTAGLSNSGTSGLVKLVTVGNTSFNGSSIFAAATPAKLYMGNGTVTDTTSAIGATNAVGAVASLAITPIAATNTSVTYTNASTLYIAGAPSAGTNITITNPYALYVNAGNVYLGGGTANGVAYLDTNKVLTTGSALVFDSSDRLIVGAGSAVIGNRMEVVSNTSSQAIGIRGRASDGTGVISWHANAASTEYARIQSDNTSALIFGTGSSGTEGMRLTSTSLYTASTINVLLGNSTDPIGGNRLLVQSAATANNNRTMSVYNTAATSTTAFANRILQLSSNGSGADVSIQFTDQVANNAYFGMGSGALYFGVNSTTKAMTLDASGRLVVGGTSALVGSTLTVAGNCLAITGQNIDHSANSLRLGEEGSGLAEIRAYGPNSSTNGSIRFRVSTSDGVGFSDMTLDASGNLLVGITSGTSYKLALKTSSASQSAIGTAGTSGDTAFQAILITKFDNDSTTSQNFIQFQINNGGANCGKITANGANTAAFGSTSDQRVKENIAELPSQLANIMALRPVEFDYLESYGGGHQIGFIAQEIQQVYPDVISTDDSSEKIMSITGWSKTEARLVKAIQELKAEFDAYKASHP